MVKRVLSFCVALSSCAAFAAIDFSGVEALADRLGGSALTRKVSFVELTGERREKAVVAPVSATAFEIRATNLRMASLALGVYLRDVAKGHISWCGNRIPSVWPVPKEALVVIPRHPYLMAYNYCTLSYTMAFWGKTTWQQEVDRLALCGYTHALVMAGIQKVWALTLVEMGYSKAQCEDFICDDAVQAWWLMGNLQALGDGTSEGRYPVVSSSMIEMDAELGAWLFAALRKVGIEPVVQGFVGLVPSSTTEAILPDARLIRTGNYVAGQKSPDLLDPTSPAFERFSRAWNKNLKRVYHTEEAGAPKYLGGDLFHESAPPRTMTMAEKINCARSVQKLQQEAFPGVIWLLQSWQGSPDQSLRDGLDPKLTLIQYLDQTMASSGSRTEVSYLNRSTGEKLPWVWVEVMNFGGNTGMYGAFRRFSTVGRLGEGVSEFKGYGLLSEGLETNPISYDLYHDAVVRDVDLDSWMAAYRARRYGLTTDDSHLKAAYEICARTVWDCLRDQQGAVESVLCATPCFDVTSVSAWGPTTGTPYDPRELVKAARLFLAAAKAQPKLLKLETFRYDFVDIFQQILADRAREILPLCAASAQRRKEFGSILDLTDRILACSDLWRLDSREARTLEKAGKDGVAGYRRMITTWTPGARFETELSNYAHRSYAGLMRHYYARRWQKFFDYAEGRISEEEYLRFVAGLARDFPTALLPKTPRNGNPVKIAEQILAALSCSRNN